MVRVALAVAAAALAASTPADASARTARFLASVEGTQRIAWSVDTSKGTVYCGDTHRGSGRETISFRSSRPQQLTVRLRGGVPTFAIGRRWARLDTRGRVSRQGTLTSVPNPNGVACGDGGPGGEPSEPLAPDCGTRRFVRLPLAPESVGRNAIRLRVADPAPLPPFRACPVYGPAFPELLADSSTGAPLPVRELLDDSIAKELVLGGGHRRESAAGITVDVRLEWTLTLERIREAS